MSSEPENLQRMSLLDHLQELRSRILQTLGFVAVAFAICWIWVQPIYDFLARPIYRALPEGKKLAFLGVTEPLVLFIKVAALSAIFLSTPVILYQAWQFVAPGLYRRERRMVLPFILAGTFFFVLGGAFAYLVAFPFAVDFLLSMGEQFEAVVTADKYFGFLLTVILGLALMFELPIFVFCLAVAGIVETRTLIRQFRWAVLLIFIAAAVITPTPDIFNMLIFALPTIALYLLGVGAAAVVTWRRKKRLAGEGGGVE